MNPKFFDHDDVERLLPMSECIEVVEEALRAFDNGQYSMPLRTRFAPPGATGVMAWMPAHRSGAGAVFGMKVLVVVPDNPRRGLHAHQGAVLLMDGLTGQLRAVLDASAVTAIRTAAASAVATRLLSRQGSSVLGIVGTGPQAVRHLESIPLVRPIKRALIAGSTVEKAENFVTTLTPQKDITVEAATTEQVIRAADIVATCTSTVEPFLRPDWLHPGLHINAVGASRPPNHELEPSVIPLVALFSDRRESLDSEAAEWRIALEQGVTSPAHFRGEIGAVLNGSIEGRTSQQEITVFRSLGLSVEDVAAAQRVLDNAERFEVAAT